ncbi:MAG: hypothetical protein WCR56_04805 [Bacilli bacterium]
MKEKLVGFLKYLSRVDVANRILVFISMTSFLFLPSYILYYIDDYNSNSAIVLPCLLLIADLVGNGLITLYRPVRVSWYYFLVTACILCIYSDRFINVSAVDLSSIRTDAIFYTEITYCIIALIINIVFYIVYLLKKRRYKSEFKEDTNADSFFDFLNGKETNKEIEKEVENIPSSRQKKVMKFGKRVKLSRFTRGLSLLMYLYVACFYFFTIASKTTLITTEIYYPLIMGVVLLPILFIASLMFPRDFKYMFYYNCALFEVAAIIVSSDANVKPTLLIVCISFLCVSLLITMITEGRAWTGATPDD